MGISEETRKKMRDNHADVRGKKNPMWGKNHSEESLKKMSKIMKGRKFSENWKNKISEGNRGGKRSEETKRKMSLAGKGRKLSDEHKKRLSLACKGRKFSRETLKKMSLSGKGKKFSEEHKRNIGKALKERVFSREWKERISKTKKEQWKAPGYAKKMFKAMWTRPTKPEIKMLALLESLFPGEYKYVGDGDVWIAGKNPDFINVNGQKKIIEVFGDYWHRNDKPSDRMKIFEPYGYKTLVIWESTLYEDIEYVEQKVKQFHTI